MKQNTRDRSVGPNALLKFVNTVKIWNDETPELRAAFEDGNAEGSESSEGLSVEFSKPKDTDLALL